MNRRLRLGTISALAIAACTVPSAGFAQQAGQAAATAPAPAPVQQRPNVLVWIMDDVGYGHISCFGGMVQTPNIDRVARNGLRYANYHTAAICSASRASILTGRMPHSVHIGGHAAAGFSIPGHDASVPADSGTVAANLKAAGYATFALGKWDHFPNPDSQSGGPYTRWATGQGFEQFYGFLAADTDNWTPTLVRNNTPVRTPQKPAYHLSEDLADEAIAMIRARRASDPARPFMMYWATGAAHAPHHAPREWIERYRGKFDGGWDKARKEILKRQISLGLVPKGTVLADRTKEVAAWDSLSADQKRLYARQMEVFAAALSHADEQFGRILDMLEASGELDNTIVIVTSDNGASAEGGPHGLQHEAKVFNAAGSDLAENLPFIDEWGGPKTFPHYATGWAVAGNTPFHHWKQTTYEGGIRVPLVVSWQKGIAARGEVRQQFAHVADVTPTILEAAGVAPAEMLNNVRQRPFEGISMVYSFGNAKAPGRKLAQYHELYGNRALTQGGWTIVTNHRMKTWEAPDDLPNTAPWELYNVAKDPGQTRNLASSQPERVAQMAADFDAQAKRYNVYPLVNLGSKEVASEAIRRFQAEFARRQGKWGYPGPVSNISGLIAPPFTSMPSRMTAKIKLDAAGVTGPVFAYGGHLGGIALYLRGGVPVFVGNGLGGDSHEVAGSEPLPLGTSTLELDFTPARVKPLTPADHRVTMRSGGRVLAEGVLRFGLPRSMGISETFDVGSDQGSAVMPGAPSGGTLDGLGEVAFDFNPK